MADLLEAGADIEAVDEEGRTPLLLALEGNRKETVDVLLKAGKTIMSCLSKRLPQRPLRVTREAQISGKWSRHLGYFMTLNA